jgi:hypothetical protein
MRDLRYAFRLIRRQPMFAALVIATLTLGIGASTSMFSVVNGVLLKPLPYEDPARLVWMFGSFRGSDSAAVSPPDFADYRRGNAVFERLGAMTISPASVTVSGAGGPVRLRASRVSADLISTLGVAPVHGRDFSRADETTASSAVIRWTSSRGSSRRPTRKTRPGTCVWCPASGGAVVSETASTPGLACSRSSSAPKNASILESAS